MVWCAREGHLLGVWIMSESKVSGPENGIMDRRDFFVGRHIALSERFGVRLRRMRGI